jgi:hypothetical protein
MGIWRTLETQTTARADRDRVWDCRSGAHMVGTGMAGRLVPFSENMPSLFTHTHRAPAHPVPTAAISLA